MPSVLFELSNCTLTERNPLERAVPATPATYNYLLVLCDTSCFRWKVLRQENFLRKSTSWRAPVHGRWRDGIDRIEHLKRRLSLLLWIQRGSGWRIRVCFQAKIEEKTNLSLSKVEDMKLNLWRSSTIFQYAYSKYITETRISIIWYFWIITYVTFKDIFYLWEFGK